MNIVQNILRAVEVGEGRSIVRVIPLVAALLVIGIAFNFLIFHGLSDEQSMDNAQLARQIFRGDHFTTEFIRPHAVTQLHDYAVGLSLGTGKTADLFPPDRFPPGTARVLPDTYNAPGYPCLLSIWFHIVHPEFDQPSGDYNAGHIYSGDRWIPPFNQIFLCLTALLVFLMGHRLFDERVAWISLIAFVGTDMFWEYSVTALSTTLLMFLITAVLFCTLEVIGVGEACFESDERPFWPAWVWAMGLGLLLAAACLTRLHLLILLAPLLVVLVAMPRGHFLLFAVVAFIVLGLVTPWFWHVYKISGNPLGSNMPLLLYGEDEYKGNQIYCTTSIPNYERLFRDASKKEYLGYRWHLEHAWNLLGANPMILLFAASILHQFKRRRTRLFHWLIFGCAIFIIGANNLGVSDPESIGPWNSVVLLAPCMIVIGSAFFFILLDRLNLQLWLLNNMIVIAALALTALPLGLTITTTNGGFSNFPPYWPPAIKLIGQLAQPDEWVTSDIPWATAWYADRASLWLPDSITDFEAMHDNVCPSGVMLLTPQTWVQPLSFLTTGEDKDWFPFLTATNVPTNFPLGDHTYVGSIDYSVWSDRPRWQKQ